MTSFLLSSNSFLPLLLASFLPCFYFLASFIASFPVSLLPCLFTSFLPSLLSSFLAFFLPSPLYFLPSFLDCFLPCLLPCVLLSLLSSFLLPSTSFLAVLASSISLLLQFFDFTHCLLACLLPSFLVSPIPLLHYFFPPFMTFILGIDWDNLSRSKPPMKPAKDINMATQSEIGAFSDEKLVGIKYYTENLLKFIYLIT